MNANDSMNMTFDPATYQPSEFAQVLTHFDQVITVDPHRSTPDNPLGVIADGAIAMDMDYIRWVGPARELPDTWKSVEPLDFKGQIVFPGFIDSHTHPAFGGDRADEFEQRLQGKSYQAIAAEGGGILKTVTATRQTDLETLTSMVRSRFENALKFGVTTIEAKSGYGLTTESELKSLQAIKNASNTLPINVLPSFMGAHDFPPEYKDRPQAYVDLICSEMIPAVAEQGLAQFNDVFCETGYFTVEQSRQILECGLEHGLKPRLHANEFDDMGAAELALDMGCVSADHLLNLSPATIERFGKSQTVATLLPGTAFFLGLKDYAPARQLMNAGATVALATDFNPGSCMTQNLQLILTLGCLQMGMTPEQAIRAITMNAAHSLGVADDRGSLTPGKRADLAIFYLTSYQELLYQFGMNHLSQLWVGGERVQTNLNLIYY